MDRPVKSLLIQRITPAAGKVRLRIFKADTEDEAAGYGIKPGKWYARFVLPSGALQDAADGAGYSTIKALVADALSEASTEQQRHGNQ